MTNLQYWKEKLLEVYENGSDCIALANGYPVNGACIDCDDCDFNKPSDGYDERSCHNRMFDWLEQEHVGFLWSPEQIAMLKALPQDCYFERGKTTDDLYLREDESSILVLYPAKLVVQFPQITRYMHYKVSELLAMAER